MPLGQKQSPFLVTRQGKSSVAESPLNQILFWRTSSYDMMARSYSIDRENTIHAAAAILIVSLLFWMDEGYYDFRWMRDPGNWLVFLLYCGGFALGEYFLSKVLPQNIKGMVRTLLVIVIGIPVGFLFTMAGLVGVAFLLTLFV
jgi:hypothetical protein